MSRLLLVALLAVAAPAMGDPAPASPEPDLEHPSAVDLPAADAVAPTAPATRHIIVPASAAPTIEAPPDLPLVDNTGYLLFKTLVVLGIVVAVIYLTLNVGARRLLQLSPTSQMLVQVVERVPLDAKKSLFVVSAAGEYLLLGSTEAGLSLLSKLPAEQVQLALAKRSAQAGSGISFLARLQALAPSARKHD